MSSVQYRTRKGSLLSEEDLIKESKKLGIPVEDIIDKYHLTKTGVNKPQPNFFERTQNNVFSPIDPDQGQNNPRYIDIKVIGRTRRILSMIIIKHLMKILKNIMVWILKRMLKLITLK